MVAMQGEKHRSGIGPAVEFRLPVAKMSSNGKRCGCAIDLKVFDQCLRLRKSTHKDRRNFVEVHGPPVLAIAVVRKHGSNVFQPVIARQRQHNRINAVGIGLVLPLR